jgi:hypothetical protein
MWHMLSRLRAPLGGGGGVLVAEPAGVSAVALALLEGEAHALGGGGGDVTDDVAESARLSSVALASLELEAQAGGAAGATAVAEATALWYRNNYNRYLCLEMMIYQ